METYEITYFFEESYHVYRLKAGNILIAIGTFNYKTPFDKIYKIELIK